MIKVNKARKLSLTHRECTIDKAITAEAQRGNYSCTFATDFVPPRLEDLLRKRGFTLSYNDIGELTVSWKS